MTKQSNHNGSESGLRGWDFGQIITIVITDFIFSSYPIDDVPKGVSFLRVPMNYMSIWMQKQASS